MRLHSQQNVGERGDGLQDVRALVEHHALGALSHCRIGDLGARRLAPLGQVLQHLGGPDDRQVCCLGQPQDLLLQTEKDLQDLEFVAQHADLPQRGFSSAMRTISSVMIRIVPRAPRLAAAG